MGKLGPAADRLFGNMNDCRTEFISRRLEKLARKSGWPLNFISSGCYLRRCLRISLVRSLSRSSRRLRLRLISLRLSVAINTPPSDSFYISASRGQPLRELGESLQVARKYRNGV